MSGTGGTKRRVFIASIAILFHAALATTSLAQVIRLYADEAGTIDVLSPPPIGEETSFYVGVEAGFPGLVALSFALPMPECIPYSIVSITPLDGIQVLGDLATGIDVALGGCRTGKVMMLKVDVMRTGESTPGCCAIEVAPNPWGPIPGELAGLDCDDVLRPLRACNLVMEGETACVQLLPPSDPSPSNGAVDIPTSVDLDFILHDGVFYGNCALLSSENVDLYMGTDQNPPRVQYGDWGPPYDPGTLEPNTTYYWRVVHFDHGAGPVSSPLWSFTTTSSPNSVAKSTWGKIKALYR